MSELKKYQSTVQGVKWSLENIEWVCTNQIIKKLSWDSYISGIQGFRCCHSLYIFIWFYLKETFILRKHSLSIVMLCDSFRSKSNECDFDSIIVLMWLFCSEVWWQIWFGQYRVCESYHDIMSACHLNLYHSVPYSDIVSNLFTHFSDFVHYIVLINTRSWYLVPQNNEKPYVFSFYLCSDERKIHIVPDYN